MGMINRNKDAIRDGVKSFIDGIMSFNADIDLMSRDEFIEKIKGIQIAGEQFLKLYNDPALDSELLTHLYHRLSDACKAKASLANNIISNDIGNREFENDLQERYKRLIGNYAKVTGEDDEFEILFESVKSQSESDMKELKNMKNENAREVVQFHGYATIYEFLSKIYEAYVLILKRRQQASGEHPGEENPLQI